MGSGGELSVIFIGDKKIRNLNRAFLGKDRPTDVIAFRYDAPVLGDIYISVDTARRQAREGPHDLHQELALLILHGVLHLAGYRDGKSRQRKEMFAAQRAWFHRLNPALAPPDFS